MTTGKVVKLEDLLGSLKDMGMNVSEDKIDGNLTITDSDFDGCEHQQVHRIPLYYGLAVQRTKKGCKGYHDVEEFYKD
jgi:hypothetical protein